MSASEAVTGLSTRLLEPIGRNEGGNVRAEMDVLDAEREENAHRFAAEARRERRAAALFKDCPSTAAKIWHGELGESHVMIFCMLTALVESNYGRFNHRDS